MKSVQDIIHEHRGKILAIVGNGITTLCQSGYIDFSKMELPGGKKYDCIWTVNGGWLNHKTSNLGFMMDDWASIAHDTDSNPREVKEARLKEAKIPIFVNTVYPEFPAFVEYPLKKIVEFHQIGYFGETTSYMVALAIMCGVKEIHFHGADYQGCKPSERACTEFWCGIAHAKGIQIAVNPGSHFMTTQIDGKNNHIPGYYGYIEPSFPFGVENNKNGTFSIDFTADRDEEIENFVVNESLEFRRKNYVRHEKERGEDAARRG